MAKPIKSLPYETMGNHGADCEISLVSIIPSDPMFVPTKDASERSVAIVRQFVAPNVEVETATYDGPVYYGCYCLSWKGVACPICGQHLDDKWWWETLEKAVNPATKFVRLDIQTPCCNRETSLNDLEYGEDVGFARFVIQFEGDYWAAVCRGLNLLDLEKALGCMVRVVTYYW